MICSLKSYTVKKTIRNHEKVFQTEQIHWPDVENVTITIWRMVNLSYWYLGFSVDQDWSWSYILLIGRAVSSVAAGTWTWVTLPLPTERGRRSAGVAADSFLCGLASLRQPPSALLRPFSGAESSARSTLRIDCFYEYAAWTAQSSFSDIIKMLFLRKNLLFHITRELAWWFRSSSQSFQILQNLPWRNVTNVQKH